MNRKTFLTSLLAFSLTVLGTTAPAMADNWELLGERTVRLVTERDIIPISSKKQYSKLKIKVKETGIEILSITIRLATGRTINPPVRIFIPKNGESRVIDLPGKERTLTSVTLVYRSRPGSTERAVIQLYGKTK